MVVPALRKLGEPAVSVLESCSPLLSIICRGSSPFFSINFPGDKTRLFPPTTPRYEGLPDSPGELPGPGAPCGLLTPERGCDGLLDLPVFTAGRRKTSSSSPVNNIPLYSTTQFLPTPPNTRTLLLHPPTSQNLKQVQTQNISPKPLPHLSSKPSSNYRSPISTLPISLSLQSHPHQSHSTLLISPSLQP